MAQDLISAQARPAVRLEAGEEASGLATMIGDLLADNLRDFPRRRHVAERARGDVVLAASDRNIAVTLSFRDSEVFIGEGAADGAPVLAGSWLELAKVCSGRLSPWRAVAEGKLKVETRGRPVVVAAAGYVLSVPASFYGDTSRRRNAMIAGGVVLGAGAVIGGIVYVRRRVARRGV